MSNKDQTKREGGTAAASPPSELITISELSQRLKVSPKKIRRDEGMPVIKWGRDLRYNWNDVIAYLSEKSAQA